MIMITTSGHLGSPRIWGFFEAANHILNQVPNLTIDSVIEYMAAPTVAGQNARRFQLAKVVTDHDGEFLGVIYRDEDEGEVSYALSIAILEEDLPDTP